LGEKKRMEGGSARALGKKKGSASDATPKPRLPPKKEKDDPLGSKQCRSRRTGGGKKDFAEKKHSPAESRLKSCRAEGGSAIKDMAAEAGPRLPVWKRGGEKGEKKSNHPTEKKKKTRKGEKCTECWAKGQNQCNLFVRRPASPRREQRATSQSRGEAKVDYPLKIRS